MLLIALIAPLAFAEDWPPNATINEAASLQVTPAGLDAVSALVPTLLPEMIEIGDVSESGGTWCFNYEFSLSNAWVSIAVEDVTITPGAGVLTLDADLLIGLNDEYDPFEIYLEVACIGDDCPAYVEPFPVNVSTTIGLEVITGDTGTPVLDATMGEIAVTYSDISKAIQGQCTLTDIIEFFRDYLGLDFYDFILGLVEGTIKDTIADMGPELETAIEDAFSSATINEQIDLNGVALNVALQPQDVIIEPSGVEVLLSGSMSAEPAACVAAWDPGGSPRSDTPRPPMSALVPGTHMGLLLSDDFANQAMYSLWRGGLLCYELSGEEPLPINTSLLGLLAGDAFDELFPETGEMIIATRPKAPPTVVYDGAHDLGLAVNDLGLHFYAEVDDRMALALAMDLDVVAGADMLFDGITGDLAVEVALSSDDVIATVSHNELVVGTDDAIEQNFAGVFDSLLGTLLGSLLSDLAFALPSFSGVGLSAINIDPAGDARDWLGLYATLGTVSYGGGEASGDCGSGCGGGCATGGPAGALPPMVLIALAALRRRR